MFRGLSEVLVARRRSRERWDPRQVGLGRDRRVFYRAPIQTACRLANPMFGLEGSGQTIDASLDGLAMFASVNWPEGSRVRVGFDSLNFEMEGIIVYRKEEAPRFRYGIKFQSLGFWQIVKWRRFLQKHYSGRLSA